MITSGSLSTMSTDFIRMVKLCAQRSGSYLGALTVKHFGNL